MVEGRGTSDALARLPLDLSGLTNLHRIANTPDLRDFYRVSQAVLVPSLRRESLGRVPMEALASGIPVLQPEKVRYVASRAARGTKHHPQAVQETIPDTFSPSSELYR